MKLTLLVGPPGSGKSTMARKMASETGATYVNQDSQGGDHMDIFFDAVREGKDIIVDRMNFNKQQRDKYIGYARVKHPSLQTEIIVLHEPYEVCLERIRARFGNHETINDEKAARGALQTFFGKYERPLTGEADKLTFVYPDGPKPLAIVCDLDGTLCDVEHRRHHVRKPEGQKKDWRSFFLDMAKDPIIVPVFDTLHKFQSEMKLVFCSGRPDDYKKLTKEWLEKTDLNYDALYMRPRYDSRQDDIIKEIILDFEILTRFTPHFMLDDRDQVVKMWRRRGFVCFQVAEGDF